MKRAAYFLTFVVFAFIVVFQTVSCASRPTKKFDQSPVIETAAPRRRERTKSASKTVTESRTDALSDTALFTEAFKGLPKNEDIRTATDEELHHGPPGLGKAAQGLGRVLDALKANPSLIPEGIEFYSTCATSVEVIDSVRAVCLRNWTHWANRIGEPAPDAARLPENIVRISRDLPPVR